MSKIETNISDLINAQIRGFARATLNATEETSCFQIVGCELNETNVIFQRVCELASQSGNVLLESNERLEIQKEVDQLTASIDRIARRSEFDTNRNLDVSRQNLASSESGIGDLYIAEQIENSEFEMKLNLFRDKK